MTLLTESETFLVLCCGIWLVRLNAALIIAKFLVLRAVYISELSGKILDIYDSGNCFTYPQQLTENDKVRD